MANVNPVGNSSGRRKRRRSRRAMSEINVTPFVDVMLVLLVIFMIAAPMMSVGVPVELPKTGASQLDTPSKPIIITINKQGDVFLGEGMVSINDFSAALTEAANGNTETKLFIRGDVETGYGDLMKVMSLAQIAGFTSIAMVSDTDQ